MRKVLIVAHSLQGHSRLVAYLKADLNIHVTILDVVALDVRKLRKKLRPLRRTDLVILGDIPPGVAQLTMDDVLPSVQSMGVPTLVLPSVEDAAAVKEPSLLNVVQPHKARADFKELLNGIWSQYTGKDFEAFKDSVGISAEADSQADMDDAEIATPHQGHMLQKQSPKQTENYSKAISTLMAIRKVSDQLREPLSNMNLAIHMLGQVQSMADRERYLQLLREEYNRELQLLNQLDSHLRAS